jgi:hypothetical protein
MSTKIKNVVYRASWRDEISANFESLSFSTATPHYTHNPGATCLGGKLSGVVTGVNARSR